MTTNTKYKSDYYLNEEQAFVIENYNQKKPFASFLPAVAGLFGKPMWVYYVNRGQCISTIGANNKNYAIMEFNPANKAYRYTPLEGFRTFLKVKDKASGKITYYEPFRDTYQVDPEIRQMMYITSYDLRLEEINRHLGIKTEVMFCTLPGEKLSGLIRQVKITNISKAPLEVEVIDGLPVIIPYYLENIDLKEMSNLRQAWMGVENYDTIPFYKIKVLPYDTAETVLVEGGNFYLNFDFSGGKAPNYSKIIVDPGIIFGNVSDFSYPVRFFQPDFTIPQSQVNIGVTPCGFGYKKITLPAGNTDTTYSLIGCASKYEKLVNYIQNTLSEDYFSAKIAENKAVIESLKSPIFTASNSNEFDLYCGQSFLDNILRGGYPILTGEGKHVFYVYSRQHGDLEREYNFFQIDSTYFSQGNAHFRDINQNRRNDVCFFPFTQAVNIDIFFNLLQLDGFNPLLLKGSRFTVIDTSKIAGIVAAYFDKKDSPKIQKCLESPFTPGGLLGFIEQEELRLSKGSLDGFINEILAHCEREDLADFKEGYWVDHWTYNNDLLEQYRAIFPDQVGELLFAADRFSYFDSYEFVAPRDQKYVLTPNGVRQWNAVVKNPEKEKMIRERETSQFKVRTNDGKGEIYRCSLLSKMICLLANKVASLDPGGIGIEMESNKPGWCDALNGLPGILGSSINESMEMKRTALILLELFAAYPVDALKVRLPEEVFDFYRQLHSLLLKETDDFKYWNLSHQAKEEYLHRINFGLSGREEEVEIQELTAFLKAVVAKADRGLQKAYDSKSGMYYTYFLNEVVANSPITDSAGAPLQHKSGYPLVKADKFAQRPIPFFLEGPVHILRVEKDAAKAESLYKAILQTGLYDRALGMYKVNDNIMDETKEIGRQNIFPRGWLENEAVFLHMEYKYLLELLRCGLYDKFFEAIQKALIPFLDPEVYGRSILENSSFIASTVHPNQNLHGTGFQSRLTGASSEFLNMWLYMVAGQKPFYLDETGKLCLEFKPVLPDWLFTKAPKETTFYCDMQLQKVSLPANTFAFNFLGGMITVYHNPAKKNTYGRDAAQIKRIVLRGKDNTETTINGSVIPMPAAAQIRSGLFARIDIYME